MITIPAHERLFGPADHRVGHYRRYSKSRVISIFEESGFEVKNITLFGGLSSLLLLLVHNLVALLERNKESSVETNGLESERWHQSDRERVFNRFLRNVFTESSRYPKNFGSSYLVVAKKIQDI